MKLTKKTIYVIILASFLIQALIITYNNFTGFIAVPNAVNFMVRLITGALFSSVFGTAILIVDLRMVNYLEARFPWDKGELRRLGVEALLVAGAGIMAGSASTVLSNLLYPYRTPLSGVFIINSLLGVVINTFMVLVLEAVASFRRTTEARLRAEMLEKENSMIRFEVLKNQLNPHFLFNSLNTLYALMDKDTRRAQDFLSEFSYLYRYILEVIEKPLVSLKEELSFSRSYLYLQGIRFGEALKVEISVDASLLECMVPPLSVQTLLENAFKHNKGTRDNPLNITISGRDGSLIVTNNLQLRTSGVFSTGVGLENLIKRYKFVAGGTPEFTIQNDSYMARLPLITAE